MPGKCKNACLLRHVLSHVPLPPPQAPCSPPPSPEPLGLPRPVQILPPSPHLGVPLLEDAQPLVVGAEVMTPLAHCRQDKGRKS